MKLGTYSGKRVDLPPDAASFSATITPRDRTLRKCWELYADAQMRKGKPQTLEQWAIAGIKSPQPLLNWYAKRAA